MKSAQLANWNRPQQRPRREHREGGKRRVVLFGAVGLVLLTVAACSGPASYDPGLAAAPDVIIELPTTAPTRPFPTPVLDTPTSPPDVNPFENFTIGNFDQATVIDNRWLPLTPGTRYIYEGVTDQNGAPVPHRLEVTVTNLTKVIAGVRTVVTFDQDFKDGELAESELAFYAQDRIGNVWRMGEHPEEYDVGQYVGAPTWFAGVAASVAGIEMLGSPAERTPSYSQGWAPSVEFTDRGRVDKTGQHLCVPAGCYDDVLVVDETSQAEAGAHQIKSFAPNIGNIRVDWQGADQTQETLELTQFIQLNSIQIAAVRIQAQREERHAYLVSPDVYGQTPPME